MGKLKLQMQISLDGFVGASHGATKFNWDNEVKGFSIANLRNVGTILLGRKTAENFIPYWGAVADDPKQVDHSFAKPMMDIPRVVLSNTADPGKWENTAILKGEIAKEIKGLKERDDRDILVYGGYSFVSSLIRHGLVDEFYFLVNPVAIGSGEEIFGSLQEHLQLKLKKCEPFACGTVLLIYILG
jgi:dihydrofolate reductase